MYKTLSQMSTNRRQFLLQIDVGQKHRTSVLLEIQEEVFP